jgi:hypothetical protein
MCAAAGLEGAMSTTEEYVGTTDATGPVPDAFAIPRFGWPDALSQVLQVAGGVERAKRALRARMPVARARRAEG